MKRLLIIPLVLLFFSANAGGGWTYVKGKGFVKISQNAIYGDRLFNPEGEVIDITTIGYYATSIYAEYGLTDRITAVAYVPFFTRNTLNKTRFIQTGEEIPGDELNSFGDMDLSLKYGFLKTSEWVGSATVLFGIPTGEPQGGETGILQSGDGEFNQMIRVDFSKPFGKAAWMTFYAGFNNRTNDFSDEYRYGGEVGSRFGERFLLIGKLDVVQSLFNGNADASQGGTIFSNNTEFVSPAVELSYELKNGLGFSLSAAGAFSAKNILAAPNFGVGVYTNF